MTRSKHSRYGRRSFALALIVMALIGMPEPERAAAVQVDFSCSLLAPNTWCRHSVWHNYHAMGVYYSGPGSMQVCARMVKRVGGGVYAAICGTNTASSGFTKCNCGGLWNDIRHGGSVAHNLHGWGRY